MKQIGFITKGHAEYDERLRVLLEASGITPRSSSASSTSR